MANMLKKGNNLYSWKNFQLIHILFWFHLNLFKLFYLDQIKHSVLKLTYKFKFIMLNATLHKIVHLKDFLLTLGMEWKIEAHEIVFSHLLYNQDIMYRTGHCFHKTFKTTIYNFKISFTITKLFHCFKCV